MEYLNFNKVEGVLVIEQSGPRPWGDLLRYGGSTAVCTLSFDFCDQILTLPTFFLFVICCEDYDLFF